MKAQIL
jgi:hypothetical protein